MADAEDLKRLIVALSAAYRTEVDQAQAATWARAIRDVDGDMLNEAVDSWIKNSTRFPRPAEILQTVEAIARRRRNATPALPEARLDPEEQRAVNRRGFALVRNQLKQGKLLVGQHVDEALKDGDK